MLYVLLSASHDKTLIIWKLNRNELRSGLLFALHDTTLITWNLIGGESQYNYMGELTQQYSNHLEPCAWRATWQLVSLQSRPLSYIVSRNLSRVANCILG